MKSLGYFERHRVRPPAPPNLLITLENPHLNTKEQSPTRIPPSAIVLLPQPLYNTINKQEATPRGITQ